MLTEFTLMQRALIYIGGFLIVTAGVWLLSLIAEGKRK
jgi:hypothetical protein